MANSYESIGMWLLPAAALVSFVLTWALRKPVFSKHMLDVPNDRSSHETPTVRGGGAAIFVAFLTGLLVLYVAGKVGSATLLVVLGGGGLIGLVGLVDDYAGVAARWRLIVHVGAAIWTLYWYGQPDLIESFGLTAALAISGATAIGLVWLVNLYNFMDGIDGIAGIEAVSVCIGIVVLCFLTPTSAEAWLLPGLLLASVGGFLYWNFPPATIFMGDMGSGFLGFVFGVICIYAAGISMDLAVSCVLMLGVFIVDATTTLIRRAVRGRPVYTAHRSHAYQFAARSFGSHKPVSIAVGLINLFWLLPVSVLVVVGYLGWAIGFVIAYGPLVFLALMFKAGAEEAQEF